MTRDLWQERARAAGAKMARALMINQEGIDAVAALARFRANMMQVYIKHNAPDPEALAEAAVQEAMQLWRDALN